MAIAEISDRKPDTRLYYHPHIWMISGFSPKVWGGGGEEAVSTVARYFADKGARVSSLHGVIYDRPLREEPFPNNLSLTEVPQSRYLDFKGVSPGRFLYFQQLIKSDRPDLVIINMPGRIGLAAALALSDTDISTYFWWHGTHVASDMQYDYQDRPSRIKSLARKLINPLKTIGVRKLAAASNFSHAACSTFTAQILEGKGLLPLGNTQVLNPPTLVGLDKVNLVEKAHLDGVRDNDLVIFLPSRVAPDKQFYNVRELMLGLQVVGLPYQRINFVSAGPAPSPEYLNYAFPQVESDTLKTTHLGVLDRRGMERVYASADLCFMPNRAEPFGLATVEAMRFGLPILGFDSGGTAEILKEFPDYPQYLIVERRDQIHIDSVRAFLERAPSQKTVALHQRKLVMDRFDPRKLSEDFFEFVTQGI